MEILVIEDNLGDARLMQEAFMESTIPVDLKMVTDGPEALAYLERVGSGMQPAPDLILLDLNLPKMDGREVLSRIKSHRHWRSIPVVILSTSSAESDIRSCYDHHANCYITKPTAYVPFLEVVKGIGSFWLGLVSLPAPYREARGTR